MAQSYIQPGTVIQYTNEGSAIASGAVVSVGSFIGVALGAIATGATGSVQIEGVFKLIKKAPLVITQGDELFWDADPGEVTKTTTDTPLGTAFESALSADTTVLVKLLGGGNGIPVAAVVAALVDNSGGAAADGTIAAVSDVATAANAVKELATTVNAILVALKNAGLMASA